MVRVLFVCLGNICRSPTAEAVFRHKVADAGLGDKIDIDSAGTAAWHLGKAPDSRATAVAAERGYELAELRARQVIAADFHEFDYLLAMDASNYADLQNIMPSEAKAKLHLILAYSQQQEHVDVPDPYYGGADGFTLVLDLLEDACDGLLDDIKQRFLGN